MWGMCSIELWFQGLSVPLSSIQKVGLKLSEIQCIKVLSISSLVRHRIERCGLQDLGLSGALSFIQMCVFDA